MRYYLPTSSLSLTVVRSVSCDAADRALVATSVVPNLQHRADPKAEEWLDLSELRGAWADVDVKLEWTEDGRLKGINTASAGQGDSIIKAAAGLATALAGAAVVPFARTDLTDTQKACAWVRQAGDGHAIAITLRAGIALDGEPGPFMDFKPTADSAHAFEQVKPLLSELRHQVMGSETDSPPLQLAGAPSGPQIWSRWPGRIRVQVVDLGLEGKSKPQVIWNQALPIAQLGKRFALPLPKPALFGSSGFAVGFADSGAVTSVQLGSKGGLKAGLDGLSTLAKLPTDMTSAEAAALKAEADKLAQQQRLANCLLKPSDCK
ncbi:hypothetical protein [Inhella proteolytica]|uniref:Uncharacterized protein n=1 Tax=Inhella proteolytica TaxID=2795029 RepID=A0A931J169_9BURK|nr:hypothetical protein [Inhella proteolytica]MBH9576833.1 hypothetical protein [Inhella proteolytica]